MEQSCKDTTAYICNLKYNELQLVNKQKNFLVHSKPQKYKELTNSNVSSRSTSKH